MRKAPRLTSQVFNHIKERSTGAGRPKHLIHNLHYETKAVSKHPPQVQSLHFREVKRTALKIKKERISCDILQLTQRGAKHRRTQVCVLG